MGREERMPAQYQAHPPPSSVLPGRRGAARLGLGEAGRPSQAAASAPPTRRRLTDAPGMVSTSSRGVAARPGGHTK